MRMMSPSCGCPFLALLGAVLHVGLICLLLVFWSVSWLCVLVRLLRPMMVAVGTAGIGDDVARDMMCFGGGGILTAIRAQLSYLVCRSHHTLTSI